MQPLPRKLKCDAIAEAIFEVRFDSVESQHLPEVALGKLASDVSWEGFDTVRLPLAELPQAARAQHPELKFQPVVELRSAEAGRIVKIGPNVFSYHTLAPYPGWEVLKPEIDHRIRFLFGQLHEFQATRLGLRYINLLDAPNHGINSISELNLSVRLGGLELEASRLVQFEKVVSPEHIVMVRLASPNFVQGPVKSFSALADVDVFSHPNDSFTTAERAIGWLQDAHAFEKLQFFELLRAETINNLTES